MRSLRLVACAPSISDLRSTHPGSCLYGPRLEHATRKHTSRFEEFDTSWRAMFFLWPFQIPLSLVDLPYAFVFDTCISPVACLRVRDQLLSYNDEELWSVCLLRMFCPIGPSLLDVNKPIATHKKAQRVGILWQKILRAIAYQGTWRSIQWMLPQQDKWKEKQIRLKNSVVQK